MSRVMVMAGLPALLCSTRLDSDVVRSALADKSQELSPRVLLLENANHGRRDGGGILLFDAAHHHAEVAGFDDDADALRCDGFLDRVGNLAGEALLHLQAAREDLDEARDFAESDHLAVGNVSDVH